MKNNERVGVVSFSDVCFARNGKLYCTEDATYFFVESNSAISYKYSFVSTTGSSFFATGSKIHANSLSTNGKFLGNQYSIEIDVGKTDRTVKIQKK